FPPPKLGPPVEKQVGRSCNHAKKGSARSSSRRHIWYVRNGPPASGGGACRRPSNRREERSRSCQYPDSTASSRSVSGSRQEILHRALSQYWRLARCFDGRRPEKGIPGGAQ